MATSYSSPINLNLGQTPNIDPSKDTALYQELLDIHNAIEQIMTVLADLTARIEVLEP